MMVSYRGGKARMAAALTTLVSLLACAAVCRASLVAIDLGSEFLKVALIKPGRTPIATVVNEMSRRKSPALVGIVNGERVLAEEAASLLARYPEAIFQRSRDLLGRKHNDTYVRQLVEMQRLPYSIVEHPKLKVAAIALSDGSFVTAEELVASQLYYAKQIASHQSGTPVVDAVIAVPASFGQVQRQAVLDAASLAGLNALSLINSHAAAALQYGIDRDFKDKAQTVLLYDMGSSSTHVALVKYSNFTVKEHGKENVYKQFEVLDADWDTSLGSSVLDMILAQHFASEFLEKHGGKDVRHTPKAMAKLRKQVKRTKEVLSANTHAPFSVEELYEGQDFASSITRQQFEELASPFFINAAEPITRILNRNNLSPDDIDAVELLGGGSRVPKLQAHLSQALGGRSLDRHLDADEAVVWGASLYAANLSTSFRLRKFGMADGYMYGISMAINGSFEQSGNDSTACEAGTSCLGHSSVKSVIPYMKKLPAKRKIHFKNVTSDRLEFSLFYNISNPHGLPEAEQASEIGRFEVSGISSVISRYNSSGTVTIRIEIDSSSILRVVNAEAVVETEYMEEQIVEHGPENVTSENATLGDESTMVQNDIKNATNQGNRTVETVLVPKHKTYRVALSIGGPGLLHSSIATNELQELQRRLTKWQESEDIKKENARAKNDLESFILRIKELLDDDPFWQKVVTQKDHAVLSEKLMNTEDWLYMDGDGETAREFSRRQVELEAITTPMMMRASELRARPAVMANSRGKLTKMQKLATQWTEDKPWINETDQFRVLEKIANLHNWLAEIEAKQQKRKDWEEPEFKVTEIEARLGTLEQLVKRINKRPKPLPPPKPTVLESKTSDNDTERTKMDKSNSTSDDRSNMTVNQSENTDQTEEFEQEQHKHDEL